MKLRQEARVLKRKALSSLVTATEAFNSPRADGRATRVLLHLQHSFEMLLKAALVQAGLSVFDRKTGRSLGFESCVCLAMGNGTMKLSEFDAGTMRAIDAMRDDEQHWFNEVPEQLHSPLALYSFRTVQSAVSAPARAIAIRQRADAARAAQAGQRNPRGVIRAEVIT
jgi:hypothetical protein